MEDGEVRVVVSVFQPGLAFIDIVQQLLTETQVLQVFDQQYTFVMPNRLSRLRSSAKMVRQ